MSDFEDVDLCFSFSRNVLKLVAEEDRECLEMLVDVSMIR